jgi:stress-induced morphogen
MEEQEIRIALTTEPVGKHHWQWVVVFASAEEIVRLDRSDRVFTTVAEALAAGQHAISEIRLRGGWQASLRSQGQAVPI